MATSRFSKVDEYGFERPDNFNYETYEEFMSEYLKVLAKRAKKWADIIGEGRSVRRNLTVKRYVRKGIPGVHRCSVWLSVSGAEELKNKSPNLYQQLLNDQHDPQVAENIRIDLPRTFPDNIFFNNTDLHQRQLYNILLAFAHQNQEVGYCQGLNYIAGLLLLVTKNEENAFWLLKVLIENILPEYYTPTMKGLLIDIDVLVELVKLKMPDVFQHVENLGLPWPVITTKWFICLFAEVLPTETTLRIWDCLFYEGSKIVFRVALTLIKRNKQNLLACQDFTDLAECFKEITKDSIVVKCHEFMEVCKKFIDQYNTNLIEKCFIFRAYSKFLDHCPIVQY
ncbi:unnamed protein product [Trichogramma brassicae]|uniref:Growth hormone-regulated TBC protein 1 n=1 Tax=Trichogramma brassicae TaxID=86971 RepID=A0A6H5J3P3_9HYME|nr:unnamed protein product [Trichogramma brassicae]